jgi:hypothetical protein
MRRLRLLLMPVVGLAGVGVATILAAIPTLASGGPLTDTAPPSTASFTAVDYAWEVTGGTATKATIAQNGTVTFGYPTGSDHHNAAFGTGPQPTSCTQTAGPSSGSVPPLPHQPSVQGWSGACTFDTPGTYTFHCDLHRFMTATIVVQPSTTSTSSSSTSGTTSTGTTSTTQSTTPTTSTRTTSTTTTSGSRSTPAPPPPRPRDHDGSPLAGTAARAIAVAAHQHGVIVHGTARISAAGVGGRLEVRIFTSRGQLRVATAARRHASRLVRIAHLVRTSLRAGRVRFALRLDEAGRRALRRNRRLTMTMTLALASADGERVTTSRHVVLRP